MGATRLRFALHGPRNNKIFHLVAIDAKKRRNAKPLETLAVFSRRKGPEGQVIEWSVSRIKYWLGVGAVPSESAAQLLRQGNILPDIEPPFHRVKPKFYRPDNVPIPEPLENK